MGRLKRFDLLRIKNEFNIDYFFETGTWKGDGVAYALEAGFKKILSTEIIPAIADTSRQRFANKKNVEIITGDSIQIFEKKLDKLHGNCIFWLDAHFPGAEEKLSGYNEVDDENIKLPLKKEIELIKTKRKEYSDVILIDDLRIYELGPYKSGNMPDSILPPAIRNIDFIFDAFNDTHNITRSYMEEGYLLILPKEKQHYSPSVFRNLINLFTGRKKRFIY